MTTDKKQPGLAGGRTTRSLVEGALLAALASLFAVLSLVPGLFFLDFAIPVPLAIVGYRYGLRTAGLSAAVALALAFLLSGSPFVVGSVLSFGALGLAAAYGVRRGWPAIQTVLLGTGVAFLAAVGQFLFSLWVMGVNLLAEQVKLYRSSIEQSLEWQRRLLRRTPNAIPPEQLKAIEEQFRVVGEQLPHLGPALFVAGSFLLGVVNYGIIQASFRRLKLGEVPAFPPFRTWRLPEWVGWMGVLAVAAGYADAVWHLTGAKVLYDNLFYLCLYAFLIEGLAVAWYYFDRWGWDKVSRVLVLVFGFMTGIGMMILLAIGFLDIFLDYRQPREGAA
ncbi:MAG: YybS family protein [Betaproteobacteria bacterium]